MTLSIPTISRLQSQPNLRRLQHDTTPPAGWPPEVAYLVRARLSPTFPAELVPSLLLPPASASASPPSSTLSTSSQQFAPRTAPHPSAVAIKAVTTKNHPAYGQRSLVARKRLEAKTLVIPYLGIVHADFTDAEGRRVDLDGHTLEGGGMHEESDYDLSLVRMSASDVRNPFGERFRPPPSSQSTFSAAPTSAPDTNGTDTDGSAVTQPSHPPPLHVSIGVDAAHAGNAARFVNDFRSVAAAPNAEFRLGRGEGGELRMEVWSTRRVEKGDEVLVSYGKGWWGARQ